MDCTLKISSTTLPISSSSKFNPHKNSLFGLKEGEPVIKIYGTVSRSCSQRRVVSSPSEIVAKNNTQIRGYVATSAVRDVNGRRSSLESLFCYDKPIPEEIIEKPIGLSLAEKNIGDNPRCPDCQTKGAVLCTTCSGSGLYVDSILESQGIIVKVRCLGCGGTGNIMCSDCGGRGHLGL